MANILPDVRHNIYELCKKHLNGKWAQIEDKDITIDYLVEDNDQLFLCSLTEKEGTEYAQVVVKYISLRFVVLKSVPQFLTMNVILSERKVTPRLLGTFDLGLIIQYVESRPWCHNDSLYPQRLVQLAGMLAKLHSCKMPIAKTNKVMATFESDHPFFIEACKTYEEVMKRLPDTLIKKYDILTRFNFIDEMKWLKKVIKELKSPFVFSHNDLTKVNILVKAKANSEDVEILLIDLEWSSYNMRGWDLGHFYQKVWGEGFYGDFPPDNQMLIFIDGYIQEMCNIFGNSYSEQEINSHTSLLKEAKIFALVSLMKEMLLFRIWRANNYYGSILELIDKLKNGETNIEYNMDDLSIQSFGAKSEPVLKRYKELKTTIQQEYKL